MLNSFLYKFYKKHSLKEDKQFAFTLAAFDVVGLTMLFLSSSIGMIYTHLLDISKLDETFPMLILFLIALLLYILYIQRKLFFKNLKKIQLKSQKQNLTLTLIIIFIFIYTLFTILYIPWYTK
jgi:formate hydrogenlyase subunit 3/multisubunit Na+/H+ antiporter MnhD subunit